mgnify:CR=1 FL=1
MKLKHNKKRNTAFLFEVLVRELTKSVIQKRSDYGIKVSKIVKEHFGKGTLQIFTRQFRTTAVCCREANL